MRGLDEGTLIVVGLGTGAFMLAFSRIVLHEAARVLDVHFLQRRAMEIRNNYARTILSLRPDDAANGLAAPSPRAGEGADGRRAA